MAVGSESASNASSTEFHLMSGTFSLGADPYILDKSATEYEPRCEKTGLRGFLPGPIQTGLYTHRRWLEA